MLVGEEIHSAKRGVTAHTTVELLVTYLQDGALSMQSQTSQECEPCTKASQEQESLGHYCGFNTRTCTSSACLSVARQQTSTLVDNQVRAGNTQLQRLGMRIDEAER